MTKINSLLTRIKSSKILKAGIWYTLGSFLIKGINFITLPIFARLLSTSDYGEASIYNTWLSVLTLIIPLDLSASVVRGRSDFKEKFDSFLSSILFLATLSLLAFLGISILFSDFISSLLDIDEKLIVLLIIHSFFMFVINFITAKYTSEYKYKSYILVSIATTFINIVLSIILIMALNDNKYFGRIIGSAFSMISVGIIVYIRVMIKGKVLIDLKYWKYALILSLPLILHSLSGLILSQSDRVMIDRFIGSNKAGIYSFTNTIAMLVDVLFVSLNRAWVPWFYEKMDTKSYKEINSRTKYYIMLFTSITCLLIFISPEIVMIMGSEDYWEGLTLVPPIMVGYFFMFLYSLPVNIEFYQKKTYHTSIGTMLAAAINIILNYIYIPKYGYTAAAWTTLISYIFMFIFHYIITKYVLKVKVFSYKIFLIAIIIIVITSIVFYMLIDLIIARYILLIVSVIFILIYYRKNNFIKI